MKVSLLAFCVLPLVLTIAKLQERDAPIKLSPMRQAVLDADLNRYPIRLTSSDSTATTLYLPDDLEATLWAESPMLHNPTSMDVDAKGRIWITEAVKYRAFQNND